jgi:MFS family permease
MLWTFLASAGYILVGGLIAGYFISFREERIWGADPGPFMISAFWGIAWLIVIPILLMKWLQQRYERKRGGDLRDHHEGVKE